MASRVLVLYGGPDAERPVSIMSGTAVAAALRELGRHEVLEWEIDRPTVHELVERRADVVFPVLHGRFGEGGPLQELLESAGLPYVGCRPRPAALAMDKIATKTLATGVGVPTPRARVIDRNDELDLAPPLVLKPVDDGSSVDLRICRTVEQVAAARADLHRRRERLMAEEFIQGREITAGIVCGLRGDGSNPLDDVLPLIDIQPAEGVYDYQAKYHRDDTRYVLDPVLPPGVADAIRRFARAIFDRLGCRDLGRVDFMVDDRGPWLLEVNTMPGFTGHSLVPMAARHAGVEMPDLCGGLVDRALARGRGAAAAGTGPTHRTGETR